MKRMNSRWTNFVGLTILVVMFLCGCQNKQTINHVESKEEAYQSDVQELLETQDITSIKEAVDATIPAALSEVDLSNLYKVKIKVNPEIELFISSETDQVMYVNYVNEDAEALVKKENLALMGSPYDQAAENFINACAKEKYLNDSNSTIEISAYKTADDAVSIPNHYTDVVSQLKQNISENVDFPVDVKCPCPYCNASGVCDMCVGTKSTACDACNGTIATECSVCHDELSIVCDHCDGKITIEDIQTCSECGNNAKWTCTICNGSGRIACETCGGNGKVNCASCNNTCTQTCNKCNGSGCSMCHNSGIMECTACYGHALDKCSNCDGSGEDYCNPCRGEGFNICNSCNGTGVIDNTHICQSCNQTGRIECPSCEGGRAAKCYRCEGSGSMVCVRCAGEGLCPHCHGFKELNQGDTE